jgi:hypothetical protein
MPGYFNLNNRVAFVTGASRGLGLAMAEALAEVGATVILNGGDANTLKVAADRMRDCGLKAETSATRQTAAPPMPATVRVRAGYALTEAMDGGLPTEELITLPTGLAKRPVYFSPACIGRSAPSPSGCCGWQMARRTDCRSLLITCDPISVSAMEPAAAASATDTNDAACLMDSLRN